MEAKRTLANLSLKLRQPPEGVYIMQKAIIVCGGGWLLAKKIKIKVLRGEKNKDVEGE